MSMTAIELASRIGGICEGDGNVLIHSIAGIRDAVEGQLTFIANSKYIGEAKSTHASAIIVPRELDVSFRPLIRTTQPYLALVKAMEILTPKNSKPKPGVHNLAFVASNVRVGKDVHIGPFAIIEDDAEIGDNTIVLSGTYIGPHTRIGKNCFISANVTIREEVKIGDRVTIHAGTVIGCDGFGYTKVDGKHLKIPQNGTVAIDDDVEIGSNVTIDRATFGKTWIKKGTKIDNLVQIAHNVVIGENCIIIAQVGIAGSTEIENDVTLAGQVAVTGHIRIGSGTIVTGRSIVTKDIASNQVVSGHPAKPHKEDQKLRVQIQRLPSLAKRVQDLEKQVEDLTKLIEKPKKS